MTLLFGSGVAMGNGLAIGTAFAHALFDSVWVGAIIAFALHLYLRWRSGLSAATRHAAWYAALVCIALLPFAGFAGSLSRISVHAASPPPAQTQFASVGTSAMPAGHATMPSVQPAPALLTGWPARAMGFARDAAPPLALAVAGVAGVRLMILLAGLFGLARVKRESRLVDCAIAPRLARSIESDPKARAVQLRISDTIDAPAAAGFRTPAILLPAGLVESVDREALEQIAMHEYAHLRRYDDWTNLFARLIERFYWFNPAVWFVSSRVDLERELACDDWAVAGANGVSGYADCLWQLAHTGRLPAFAATAPGAFLTRNQIVARIEHLLEQRRDGSQSPRASKLLAFAPVLAAALVLAAGRAPSIPLHVEASVHDAAAMSVLHHQAAPKVVAVAPVPPHLPVAPIAYAPDVQPVQRFAAQTSYASAHRTAVFHASLPSSRTVHTVERLTMRQVVTHIHAHEHLAMRTAQLTMVSVGTAIKAARNAAAEVATAETLADAASTETDDVLAASVETDAGSPAEIDRNILAHCSGCDMSGKDLRGADLHDLSLAGDDLSDADLRGANLRGTIFTGVDLSNAKLDGSDLRNAVLTGSDIDGATFTGAKTDGIKLVGMQLNDSLLATGSVRWIIGNCSGCDLSGLDLRGRDLHGITLSGADLNHADLQNANLAGAHLNGVDLEDANLDGADLRNAQLNGCDLQGATLDHALTQGMELQGSALSDDDMDSVGPTAEPEVTDSTSELRSMDADPDLGGSGCC